MSVKKLAESFVQEDCYAYPLAVQYGEFYRIAVDKEDADYLVGIFIPTGEVFQGGWENCLSETILSIEYHAWRAFEAHSFYTSKGATPPEGIVAPNPEWLVA